MRRVGPFDLKKNDQKTSLIMLDIPLWTSTGYYDIRASAVGDNIRRVKHREIYIR
jgi:hypothetical protein